MNYIEFKDKFQNSVIISKREVLLYFKDFDNKNLTYWQKKGYIKKLIKNYYYFSELKIDNYTLFNISNNIYFPSYISSFTAMWYYNLIPEQVTQIISVTSNSSKTYKTDISLFKYHNIKKELFWGYIVVKIGNINFYIADIEKTILDFFYYNKNYKTKQDIESLRLNYEIIKEKLDVKKLKTYLKVFDNKTLSKTVFILLSILENA